MFQLVYITIIYFTYTMSLCKSSVYILYFVHTEVSEDKSFLLSKINLHLKIKTCSTKNMCIPVTACMNSILMYFLNE